jgi:hypothetical protein
MSDKGGIVPVLVNAHRALNIPKPRRLLVCLLLLVAMIGVTLQSMHLRDRLTRLSRCHIKR